MASQRNIVEYKIIKSVHNYEYDNSGYATRMRFMDAVKDINTKIKEVLERGYQPYGDLKFIYTCKDMENYYLLQTVVKYEPSLLPTNILPPTYDEARRL